MLRVNFREGKLPPSGYLDCSIGELFCNRFPTSESIIEEIIYRQKLGYDTLLLTAEQAMEILDVPFVYLPQQYVKKDLNYFYNLFIAYTNGRASSKTVRSKACLLGELFLRAELLDHYDDEEDLFRMPYY